MPPFAVPDLPKFIVNSSGKHKYVFTYRNRWDPVKQRAYRTKGDSKCVGKLLPVEGKDDCGEIVFTEEFLKQHPALEHLRVFRYRGGRLEFEPKDEAPVGAAPHAVGGERLHAGATRALDAILEGTALMRALRETFPDGKIRRGILALAYYLAITRDATFRDFETFVECTWLPCARGLSDEAVKRLLGRIREYELERFSQNLIEASAELRESRTFAKRRLLMLDVTSAGAAACERNSDFTDCLDPPSANALLTVDAETGELVDWRCFGESAPDLDTLKAVRKDLTEALAASGGRSVKPENVVLVTDKLCVPENAVVSLDAAPLDHDPALKERIEKIVDENRLRLLDWNNLISFIERSAVTVPISIPAVDGRKKSERTLYVHLYYDKAENDEAARCLNAGLTDALRVLRTNPARLTAYQRHLLAEFTKEDDGKTVIRMDRVEEGLRRAGLRVLASDAIEDSLESFLASEERHRASDDFASLAAPASSSRLDVPSTAAWEGRVFVRMLATVLTGMVRARIRAYDATAKEKKLRVRCGSDAKLLARLHNVFVREVPTGWAFEATDEKKQELFRVIGLPVPVAGAVFGRSDDEVYGDEDDDFSL